MVQSDDGRHLWYADPLQLVREVTIGIEQCVSARVDPLSCKPSSHLHRSMHTVFAALLARCALLPLGYVMLLWFWGSDAKRKIFEQSRKHLSSFVKV